jgi:hypothetical protein
VRQQLSRWRAAMRRGRVVVEVPRVAGSHLSESDLSTVVGGAGERAECSCAWYQSGPGPATRGNPAI